MMADKDMDLLKQRLVASLQPNGADAARRASEDGQRAAQTLAADGSWADVDYQELTPGSWKAMRASFARPRHGGGLLRRRRLDEGQPGDSRQS